MPQGEELGREARLAMQRALRAQSWRNRELPRCGPPNDARPHHAPRSDGKSTSTSTSAPIRGSGRPEV